MFARIFFSLFLAVSGLMALAPHGVAEAQPRYDRRGEMPDGVQPLDRLLPGIRRSHPGEFYDAEGPTYGPTGDPHYHLKWMTPDGRIIWFDADARSGRVLRSSPGRDSFVDRGEYRERRGEYQGRRGEAPRPFIDRYPPYTADPYDRGYGRERARERERYVPNFVPGPRYGNPYGERRGRWRRER
jgi:hypothetical protein